MAFNPVYALPREVSSEVFPTSCSSALLPCLYLRRRGVCRVSPLSPPVLAPPPAGPPSCCCLSPPVSFHSRRSVFFFVLSSRDVVFSKPSFVFILLPSLVFLYFCVFSGCVVGWCRQQPDRHVLRVGLLARILPWLLPLLHVSGSSSSSSSNNFSSTISSSSRNT